MSCDATDVRLGAIAREIESLHGEWLVLMRRDATDVRLERLPAESSVYMGNGWISRGDATKRGIGRHLGVL